MATWPIPDVGSPLPRKFVELTNAEYDDRIDYWEFFRHSDELTGGYTASVQSYDSSTDIPDVDKSYLIPHEKENEADFSRRVAKATPPRYVQEGITSIVGVLTQQSPNRSQYPEALNEWMPAVNAHSETWQHVISTQIAPMVERYGLVYTLAARPTFGGETKGEQDRAREAAGLPEVLIHIVSPEAVKWWVEDDSGNLEIVHYVESVTAYKGEVVAGVPYPTEEVDVERHWFLTKEGWYYADDQTETLGPKSESMDVVDRGYWISEGEEMQNFPLTKWALKDERAPTEVASFAQLAYFRAESELKVIEEASAFAMIWVPMENQDSDPSETVKGPDVVGGFPAEGSHTPMILETSGVSFTHFVKERLPELEEQSLSPYGRSREVGGNDSGVALAHIQETAVNIYRQHSKAFSSSEFTALLPVAELLGADMPTEAKAEWPKQFGTLSDEKQMSNLETFRLMEPGEDYERRIIEAAGEVTLPAMTQAEKEAALDTWEKEQADKKQQEEDMNAQARDLELEAEQDGLPFAANPESEQTRSDRE